MKKNLLIFPLVATILIFSCSQPDKKVVETTKDSTAVTVTPVDTAKKPEMKMPENVVEASFTVKDYTAWRKGFDADSAARMNSGLNLIVIGRSEKIDNVLVVLSADNIEKAKAFMADPRLKAVMDKNGVTSKPAVHFWHIVSMNPDSKEKDWVEITHKVKDFDAWKKAFDGEGTASRAGNGLIDVALARSVEDPNLVHIVFDIKDMAKAKARINDPALKKLMMDSGVEGAPKVEYFSTAE